MNVGVETLAVPVGADGAVLHGEAAGEGAAVVFLHAGVCDHRMWSAQVEAVAAAGFRAIAYTRRGFGQSTSPDEPFSHLNDLAALLDQLDIRGAVFVGCSMGGGLAIDFALAHPGRVIGLVLVATALTGGDRVLSGSDEAAEAALEAAAEQGADAENLADARAWLDGPRSEEGRVAGVVRDLFLEMNATNLRQPPLTRQERPSPAKGRLDGIAAPALLVAGGLDFDYILRRHEQLSRELPNASAVVLDGTAHLPSLERPDLFNPLLIAFLGRAIG